MKKDWGQGRKLVRSGDGDFIKAIWFQKKQGLGPGS